MSESLCSLPELFAAPNAVRLIVIPMIQRDYAQGRPGENIKRIRTRFLKRLKAAVAENNPVTLDFIYGDITDGVFTPLDGQQRLTTLFLLHWYAAVQKGFAADDGQCAFLLCFSYETRSSSREFCKHLATFRPSLNTLEISEQIIDQPWFALSWKSDPTIASMLCMIDDIHTHFKEVAHLWESLLAGAVRFHFLPVSEMGLTDDLYIKMNSRGKPLTLFENFKAELEGNLTEVSQEWAKGIIRKIDTVWTDMLWHHRGENHLTDHAFLCYFRFVCDVLCYEADESMQEQSLDLFDITERFFTGDAERVRQNGERMEELFDCWLGRDTETFFKELFSSEEHVPGKVLISRISNEADCFDKCLRDYADVDDSGKRHFSLKEMILLYSVTISLLKKPTESPDRRRLRMVVNLLNNSDDEISDSTTRIGGNRMPEILRQVTAIMTSETAEGVLAELEKTSVGFNAKQLEEEKTKLRWTEEHPEKSEKLYALEDHKLLYGQIAILGLEHEALFPGFTQLFQEDRDAIDCALMSLADYARIDRNGWRARVGTKGDSELPWQSLFHQSNASHFETVRDALLTLLQRSDISTSALWKVVESFISKAEADRLYTKRYYYVKYPEFRPGATGRMAYWGDRESDYACIIMRTESAMSSSSYNPFFRAAFPEVEIAYSGTRLMLADGSYLVQKGQRTYELYDKSQQLTQSIVIHQNDSGIDIEDRIVTLREKLSDWV